MDHTHLPKKESAHIFLNSQLNLFSIFQAILYRRHKFKVSLQLQDLLNIILLIHKELSMLSLLLCLSGTSNFFLSKGALNL